MCFNSCQCYQCLAIYFFIRSFIFLYSSILSLNFLSPIYKFYTILNCNFFDCLSRSSSGWLNCTFTFRQNSCSSGLRFGFLLNRDLCNGFTSDNCYNGFTFLGLPNDIDSPSFLRLSFYPLWPLTLEWPNLYPCQRFSCPFLSMVNSILLKPLVSQSCSSILACLCFLRLSLF